MIYIPNPKSDLRAMARRAIYGLVAVVLSTFAGTASAGDRYVLPLADAEKGRDLFINKGCVVCHSVNDVGGTVAPALDAAEGDSDIDPYEFLARMWRGADAMLLLQAMELGYHIEFSAEEIAHIDRFLHDRDAQSQVRESDIPDLVKQWMIDELYERL